MKKLSAKAILIPTVSLLLICAVTSTLLALTNKITAQKITEMEAKAAVDAQSAVLPEGKSFEDGVITYESKEYTYHIGKNDAGETAGYVITTSANGYGGPIKVMTGIDPEGTVTGMEILSLNETAGLGMNADQKSFKDQFTGLIKNIGINKGAQGDNEIQAITGATITSKAVTKAVNEALSIFDEITGGEK